MFKNGAISTNIMKSSNQGNKSSQKIYTHLNNNLASDVVELNHTKNNNLSLEDLENNISNIVNSLYENENVDINPDEVAKFITTQNGDKTLKKQIIYSMINSYDSNQAIKNTFFKTIIKIIENEKGDVNRKNIENKINELFLSTKQQGYCENPAETKKLNDIINDINNNIGN